MLHFGSPQDSRQLIPAPSLAHFSGVLIADSSDEEHSADLILKELNHFLNGDGSALNQNRCCLCVFYTLLKITYDIPGFHELQMNLGAY